MENRNSRKQAWFVVPRGLEDPGRKSELLFYRIIGFQIS
jgi:hypothetical protein